MKSYLVFFVVSGFLNSGNSTTDEKAAITREEKTSHGDPKLRQELLRRFDEDQKARQAVLPLLENQKISWCLIRVVQPGKPTIPVRTTHDRPNPLPSPVFSGSKCCQGL
jgi:hypothetical protein